MTNFSQNSRHHDWDTLDGHSGMRASNCLVSGEPPWSSQFRQHLTVQPRWPSTWLRSGKAIETVKNLPTQLQTVAGQKMVQMVSPLFRLKQDFFVEVARGPVS